MEQRWEDAIDVDDSDLVRRPSLSAPRNPSSVFPALRPCSRTHNSLLSSRRAIPGPAGAVQAAMNRAADPASLKPSHYRSGIYSGSRSDTLEVVNGDRGCGDSDFELGPWLQAMSLIGEDSVPPAPIGSIKNREFTAERLPLVVGIVKACRPNGLGVLFLTLKDPTGTIDASVHRKVLSDGSLGGNIAVGCVLILKQVVVFFPACWVSYLNITLSNVEKIIDRDIGPPINFPSVCSETQLRIENRSSPSSSRQGAQDLTEPPNSRVRSEKIAVGVVGAQPNHESEIVSRSGNPLDHPTCCLQSVSNATTLLSSAGDNSRSFQSKSLISGSTLVHWTDKQLEELFADYEDNAD